MSLLQTLIKEADAFENGKMVWSMERDVDLRPMMGSRDNQVDIQERD